MFLVLTVISLLAAMGMGLLSSSNGFGSDADEAQAQVTKLAKMVGEDAKPVKEAQAMVDGFKTSSIGALLVVVLSLGFLILTFMKKAKPQLFVGIGIIAVAGIFAAISPSFETGPLGGADPRTQVLIFGVPAILGVVFGLLAQKKAQQVQA